MTQRSSNRRGADPAPDPSRAPLLTDGGLWALVLLAALIGLALTTIQIIEKVAILQDPFTRLACDVNSMLSCSNVLTAWQSSVLGPPNSFIGAAMFAFLGSAAVSGLLASKLSRAYLTTVWGLALFFLAFASWFMYETAFDIGALCLWCIGITTAVVCICATLTRLADRGNAFGQTRFGRTVAAAVRRQLDLAVWGGWWLGIAAMLWIGLGT
jgi:uncharacterized membrane protein